MTSLQVFLLAIAATLGLVVFRTARANRDQSPLPDGKAKYAVILGFLFLPPLVLGALVGPPTTTVAPIRGTPGLLPYLAVVITLVILMWIVAVTIRFVAPGRAPRLLLIALAGSEEDPDDFPVDPPLTPELVAAIGHVDQYNAAFPRGRTFPAQVDRSSFRPEWDALDAATTTLEGRIADDRRSGTPVASSATAIAGDARSRLETLRHLAADHGQIWAIGSGQSTHALSDRWPVFRTAADADLTNHRTEA
jgi:hypothetical protein